MKKVLKRFVVYNKTQKKYSSIPELARIIGMPQKTLYNRCNADFVYKEFIIYNDGVTGDEYQVTVLG
jgi:hypothetical protein